MRKTHTLFFRGHRTLLLLAFVIVSTVLFAQEAPDTDYIVMHVEDIDAYSYGDLARSLKGNNQISIAEACVPASLVAFKVSDSNSRTTLENVTYIKSLIASATDLETFNFKEGFTETELRFNCEQARKGLLTE